MVPSNDLKRREIMRSVMLERNRPGEEMLSVPSSRGIKVDRC